MALHLKACGGRWLPRPSRKFRLVTFATPRQLPLAEFIPLMALLTALDAMSIDMMLPALPAIGRDLHLATANDAIGHELDRIPKHRPHAA